MFYVVDHTTESSESLLQSMRDATSLITTFRLISLTTLSSTIKAQEKIAAIKARIMIYYTVIH